MGLTVIKNLIRETNMATECFILIQSENIASLKNVVKKIIVIATRER